MDEKLKPEVIIKKDFAAISLNQDGKISITMDKDVFIDAIGEVFKSPLQKCPKLIVCLYPKFNLIIDDIWSFVDKGILNKNDLTVDQFKTLESIRL